MTIEFCAINEPEDWMQMVAEQFGTEVMGDGFTVPTSVGSGYFRQYYPLPWLTLTYIRFMMFEPMTMVRHSVENSKWIPIMFYINEQKHEQTIGASTKAVGIDTLDGIFMPSSSIPTEWSFVPHQWYENITLTFNRDRIEQIDVWCESYIGRLLRSEKSFYLFETITPAMQQLLVGIKSVAEGSALFSALHLHGKAIDLLTMFFEKLEKRSQVKSLSNLNLNDVESVFQVRRRILHSLSRVPSIPELAVEVHMSSSKLQKCFKQVIGKAIAEYALSERMEWAKRLLATRLYSVSEVGYKVGYTNLSHFTEAFRKYHGLNPKQYLTSL
ncbi:MAG: AraC family transcriptional regulator [Porphyromonas sp.]|nr:AraC family transcriptional regulator [Porphyromonas sp.]